MLYDDLFIMKLPKTLTLEEIGKKNGYTREYARQIEEK